MKISYKSFIAALLLFSLFLSFAIPAGAVYNSFSADCSAVSAHAFSVVVYDMTNGVYLYEKNSENDIRIASMTKIATACTAAQYLDAEDNVTVGDEQNLVMSYASSAGIKAGETYSFRQLLHAMFLPSGCDAAYAIAAAAAKKASGRSYMPASEAIEYFCGLMTSFAREKLGCEKTVFVNPDGQDEKGQNTTAREYVRFGEYALNDPLILSVVSKSEYSCFDKNGNYHYWANTNTMMNPKSPDYYPGAAGIKTGTTPEAGYCLMFAAVREGRTVITLVCNTASYYYRNSVTSGLMDLAFAYRMPGDVNSDFRITSEDARLILRASVGLYKLTQEQRNTADIDSDGLITSADARSALRISVGLSRH